MSEIVLRDCARRVAANWRPLAFGLALLMALPGAHSAPMMNMDPEVLPNKDFQEEDSKPQADDAIVLPPFPQPGNLLPVETNSREMSFALDAKSLSIGKDGVIRYTLVATSRSGVKNISYEGLRCKTFEYRRYAFWGDNGKWSLARSKRWNAVSSMAPNQAHITLARDYFCDGRMISGTDRQILDRIRYQRVLEY